MAVKILGAGLAGMSAAVNLKLGGKEVEVFERKGDVGDQIKQNYQCLLSTHGDPDTYFKQFNLKPQCSVFPLSKAILVTRTRVVNVNINEDVIFYLRGGSDSLEYGIYRQARDLGVNFHFNQKKDPSEMDIVATGRKRCDMVAFGCKYEDLDFPRDAYLYMHDDRFSPRGWYLYILPLPGNRFKVVNCTSWPHLKQVKRLYFKAIKEKEILREYIGDAEPVETFGGFGGCHFPRSAIKGRTMYIGEAAGFQDPFRGFGMNYAMESGYLAARAILEGKNYDRLWKTHFRPRIKKDLYLRYAMVAFGDRAIEHAFRKLQDGGEVDFGRVAPSGFKGKMIMELFYRLAKLRHWRTGHW